MGKPPKSSIAKEKPGSSAATGPSLPPPSYATRAPQPQRSAAGSASGGRPSSSGIDLPSPPSYATRAPAQQRPMDPMAGSPRQSQNNNSYQNFNAHGEEPESRGDIGRRTSDPNARADPIRSHDDSRRTNNEAGAPRNLPLFGNRPLFEDGMPTRDMPICVFGHPELDAELKLEHWHEVPETYVTYLSNTFREPDERVIEDWFHDGKIFAVHGGFTIPFGVFPDYPAVFRRVYLTEYLDHMRVDGETERMTRYIQWLRRTGLDRWVDEEVLFQYAVLSALPPYT